MGIWMEHDMENKLEWWKMKMNGNMNDTMFGGMMKWVDGWKNDGEKWWMIYGEMVVCYDEKWMDENEATNPPPKSIATDSGVPLFLETSI